LTHREAHDHSPCGHRITIATASQGQETTISGGAPLNLRQIEVFHAVYSLGSVSAAARALAVSQPSVSKVVKHAEIRLGFSLFQLVRGRLVPTREAHLLFREVDDLHGRIEALQRTARNLRSSMEGGIRIGVLPSLALSVVPEAIARFHAFAPRVQFEVSTVHHDGFGPMLAARDADLAIGHDLLHEIDVEVVTLGKGRVGALFRRDLLPELAELPERMDDALLEKHGIIGLAPSVAIVELAGSALFAADVARERAITVRTVYVAAALARYGAGIAIVDEFTARGLMTPELCFLPLQSEVSFTLNALHLAGQPLSRQAQIFLDVLRQVIADRP
jgi:DNA-binding transcriptional LysR family regulator